MFHTNIFNFTAIKFGTCYMISKQITEDGLDEEPGMLGQKQTVVNSTSYMYVTDS